MAFTLNRHRFSYAFEITAKGPAFHQSVWSATSNKKAGSSACNVTFPLHLSCYFGGTRYQLHLYRHDISSFGERPTSTCELHEDSSKATG